MPSPLAEIEDFVRYGTLGPNFELPDPYFRAVIGFWTSPTLDALYYGFRCVGTLSAFGLDPQLAQYRDHDFLKTLKSWVISEHFEEHYKIYPGSVWHSKRAFPSLYASELFSGILAYMRDTENSREYKARGLTFNELKEELNEVWVNDFSNYVAKCELPEGGFVESLPGLPQVTTTERGLTILNQLGRNPQYLDNHLSYLSRCWVGACANRPREREGLVPTRYCVDIAARYLTDEWKVLGETQKMLLLDKQLVNRSEKLIGFIEGIRHDGGFSYQEKKAESVVATWHVMYLQRSLEQIVKAYPAYGSKLQALIDVCSVRPEETVSFLKEQSHEGGFGWIKDSNPNLYAMAAASRVANSTYLHPGVSETSKGELKELAKAMMNALLKFRTKDGLFQCYRV